MTKIIKIRPAQDVFSISWIMHIRCNYDCMYCPTSRHNNTDQLPSLEQLQLYWEQIFSKSKHLSKKYKLSISGGEPTINKNLLPFLDWLDKNYKNFIEHINLITNGSASKNHYLKLCKLIDSISFSTHTEFMDEKKFFNNVLACSDYMYKNNKSCHVNLMEEYWALDNLQKFATFCETHGINYSHSPIIYDYKIRDFPLLNKHKVQN